MTQSLGNYTIIRKLGEGGMGKIYLVQDPDDGSFWAAKEFKGDLTRPLLVQRFRREFRALQALNHEAIIEVRNLEYSQNRLYFLMEYVQGTSLDQILAQPRVRNTAWIKQVLRWMRYLCDPLDYIHSQNMIHRDLKPGNIMITESPGNAPVKLLDFGVIHWTLTDSLATGKPSFFGSLRYMAPEQVSNDIPDRRSDLYSMGVLLYEALTGKPPFAIDNPLLLMNLHQTVDPAPPQKLNVYISDNLQNLMLALLFKRPDDRPASAAEVADWIDQITDDKELHMHKSKYTSFSSSSLFHPEFIGREQEMRLLMKAWHQARRRNVQICAISGPGGIGKSRLINQLVRMPDLSVSPVCKGDFQTSGITYSGFVKALKNTLKNVTKKLKYGHPVFLSSYDNLKTQFLETIDLLESRSGKSNIQYSLQERCARIMNLLSMLSGDRPMFLVLDDLHNATNADLTLLKSFIELYIMNQNTEEQQGLFIVLGFRFDDENNSEPLSRFVDWLNQKDFAVNCELQGLSNVSTKRVIQSMMGGTSAPALADAVYPGSGGNPLHIIEKVKEIIDSKPGAEWQHVSDDDEITLAVADEQLDEILFKRMDKIRSYAHEVLSASAVLGNSFGADELDKVCSIDDDRFLDQIDYLIRHQILEEDPSQRDSYRFTHIKLKESVLNTLKKNEKAELHCRCLETLETIHADNYGPVSHRLLRHAEACQLPEKVFRYHRMVSDYTTSLGDYIAAQKHLEKALKLYSDQQIDTDQNKISYLDAKVTLGSLLRITGEPDRAEALLKNALQELELREPDEMYAKIHLYLGILYGYQGKINLSMEHFNIALAVFNKLGNAERIASCYLNMGSSYNYVGDFDNLRKYSALALEKAYALDDNDLKSRALINLGVSFQAVKDFGNARSYLNQALELTHVMKHEQLKGHCLCILATCCIKESKQVKNAKIARNLVKTALDYLEKVYLSSKKTGDLGLLGDCLYKRAFSNHALGNPFEEDIDRAIGIFEKLGHKNFLEEALLLKQNVSTKGG